HRQTPTPRRPPPPTGSVASELEEKPLSSEHGGPVRLYVAPMYGYKSCKWLPGPPGGEGGGGPRDRHSAAAARRRVAARTGGSESRMPATTRPLPDPAEGGRLLRFDRVERVLHWTNATLFLTL